MTFSIVGYMHLTSSILALIFGTFVLVSRKGSIQHKRVGYLYVMSMLVLIVTAFAIYRLFNSWGMFHYMALVSLTSIALGMIPVWTKKPINKWKYMHFSFMYWSVIGLYSALAAELLTRVPKTPFFGMVGIATGIISMIGFGFFMGKKSKWKKVYKKE